MKVVLVPCGLRSWLRSERLLGRTELSTDPEIAPRLGVWAQELRALGVARVWHSPDELARQTAKSLARHLGVGTRAVGALAEVDVGLWAGLTVEQLRARFTSAHRQLMEAPLSVTPPEGENLGAAAQRIFSVVSRLVRRNGAPTLALVLRPLALALARHALEGGEESSIWDNSCVDEPVTIGVTAAALAPKTED